MEDISGIFAKFILGMVVLFAIGYASILYLSYMSSPTTARNDITVYTYIKVTDMTQNK